MREMTLMTDPSWLFVPLLLLGLVSLLLLFQDRFIYFPVRYSKAQLEEARIIGVQAIKFRTRQGNQAAFLFRQEPGDPTPENLWLVFGGNGDAALQWLDSVRAFHGPGTSFLLIDYPGYGICQGRPNPQTILENSECALQALLVQKDWKLRTDTLCLLGHSLGGAAALQFAARHAVRKILVLSTFSTMADMVRAQTRIPLGRLLRHRFDNVAALKAILSRSQVPEICILHGQADEIIPPKMGRALAQLDSTRIQFVEVPGARHNDIVERALPLILHSLSRSPISGDL
jgi:alpha-beta hydrolase superfamily lysophospholipase